jgi:hypothetical protein
MEEGEGETREQTATNIQDFVQALRDFSRGWHAPVQQMQRRALLHSRMPEAD